VLSALVLAACTKTAQTTTAPGTSGEAGPKNATTIAHTLRIGDIQDITSLNPHLATATSLGNLSELTMAYLARYDENNRPVPELATDIPTQANGGVSKDGLTITWHLRHGVKWSDGAPFDADDVVFSTNAVNNPANNEVGRDGWELITKIDEPDKFTVVYHLKKPYSGYLPTFFGSAGANPCIIPKHLLGNLPNINNADYNSKPVGIGPYRYVKWVRSDHVELEANPYYWRGTPKITKITYRFIPDRNTLLTQLQTGEIDVWPYVGAGYYDRVMALPTVKVIRHPSFYYSHVDFNTSHPALADARVRTALEYATDRETIREKVNHNTGTLSETQVTPVSPMRTERPLRPYDVAKANQLLDEAGWVRGADGIRAKNGVKLNLVFSINTGAADTDQMIEIIRQSWAQVGVSLDVHHYAQALFFGPFESGGTIYSGKFDVTSFAWGMTPDADYTPQNNCDGIPPKGQNITRLCDPVIQGLLTQEKAAYDEGPRKAIIAKLDDRLDEVVPYFILYVRDDIHGINKDLQNWHPNSITPFDAFLNVDI
ncbi:MAG: peptide ABC transporter substrate-binding protein, partial [Candidatus Eremiobacteraeota bacterium]|nr:peptide ABC transporter substrate-binding protein [Candidatus Eremiobacteraeota bacterium]